MSVARERLYQNKIHPRVLALVIGCISITMMFAAFTSAYIVRQAAGNWLEFPLPTWFYVSAGIVLCSSLTLQGSYNAFQKGNAVLYRGLLIITMILGIAFVISQIMGWESMQAMGVDLAGNPSGSFVYILSAVHVAHVLAGIGILIVALLHAFILKFKPTMARKIRFQQTLIYWHFVDILWLYLLFFFLLQQTS